MAKTCSLPLRQYEIFEKPDPQVTNTASSRVRIDSLVESCEIRCAKCRVCIV